MLLRYTAMWQRQHRLGGVGPWRRTYRKKMNIKKVEKQRKSGIGRRGGEMAGGRSTVLRTSTPFPLPVGHVISDNVIIFPSIFQCTRFWSETHKSRRDCDGEGGWRFLRDVCPLDALRGLVNSSVSPRKLKQVEWKRRAKEVRER